MDARWALYRHSPGAHRALVAALATSPHFSSSALRVETDASDGGLRVVAARPLKRGELVLRVDAAHALSARTAFADAAFAPRAAALYAAAAAAHGGGLPTAAAAELRGDPERRLAFLAWLQHHVFVLRGASPWAPLLRMLPTAAEVAYLPLLWGERDVAAAAGAPLFGALLGARRALSARALAALRGSFWSGGGEGAAPRRAAELAYLEAVLDSRSYAAANPVDAYALLPFVDLLNHAEGAQPPGRSLRPFNASRDSEDAPGGPVFEGGGVRLAVAGGGAPFVPTRAAYRVAVYTQVAHADVEEGAEVFSNYGGGGGGGGGGDGAVKACAASRLLQYGFAKGADCGALRAEDWAAGCGRAARALARAGARRAAPPGAEPLLAAIDALAAGGGGGGGGGGDAPWEMGIFGGDVEALASAVGVAAALAAPAGAAPDAARSSAAACLRGAAAAAAARTRAAHAALQAQWEAGAPGLSPAAAAALSAVFEGAARAAAWAEGAAESAAALAV